MKKMLLVEMSSLCFKLQASVPNYSETRTVCINILEVAVCYFGMRWINGHYLITIDDTIKIYIPSVLEPIGTINISLNVSTVTIYSDSGINCSQ